MLGQETEITLKDEKGTPLKDKDGKVRKYCFGRIGLPLLLKFAEWVAEKVGDPFAEASRLLEAVERQPEGKFKDALAAEYFAERNQAKAVAEQLKFFDIACPLAHRALGCQDGQSKLCHLLLQAAHPDIMEEEAFEVFQLIGQDELARVTQRGMGKAEKNGVRPAAPESGVPAWEKTKSIAG